MDFFDIGVLDALVEEGFITSRANESGSLLIHNYTPKTQYERFWNPVTLQCRGLITTPEGRVVARPFPKFFNLGEIEDARLPEGDFEVYEKMDGSLGILYFEGDRPRIATRGSFQSEQSQVAEDILRRKYAHVDFSPEVTYLFEIIYPENRIVVDYGRMEDLVLLGMIETATGRELALPDEWHTPVVRRYHGIRAVEDLRALEEDNREGFVVRFENGYRVKVKFGEYVRLHRILTGIHKRTIWEYLLQGCGLEELIRDMPDEFYRFVRNTEAELHAAYREIEETAKREMRTYANRKEAAAHILGCTWPHVMFAMLDGKDYSYYIWQQVRPDAEKPFASDEA